MRIAMIGSRGLGSGYGGIERCLDKLCPQLVAMGHEVDVYSAQDVGTQDFPAGLRNLPTPSLGGKHFSNITRSALATIKAAGQYDVIHFHATGPGILASLTRLSAQPTVVTIHALDQRREKWGWTARQALQLAEWTVTRTSDRITVVSEPLRRYFRERYDTCVDHIPNGLPSVECVAPGNLLAKHGLQAGNYLLFAARLGSYSAQYYPRAT